VWKRASFPLTMGVRTRVSSAGQQAVGRTVRCMSMDGSQKKSVIFLGTPNVRMCKPFYQIVAGTKLLANRMVTLLSYDSGIVEYLDYLPLKAVRSSDRENGMPGICH
jgi:hypothetical protein